MKSKHTFITLAFQTLFTIVSAQAPFQKIISGLGFYESNASQITPDNGLIFVGQNALVKIDSNQNEEWITDFQNLILQSVKQTPGGGYIVCGMVLGTISSADYLVIRTDSTGDTLWTRSFGGASNDWAYAVEITPDSAFIVGGNSASLNGAFALKINDQGDTLWTKTFGNFSISSIKQTSDGNFIIAGTGPGAGNWGDAFLIKINPGGDTLWTKSFGNSFDEHANDVIQTSDGGYAIIGSTNSFPNAGQVDLYLIKTDSMGNLLWSKAYGGGYVDEGYALKQTSDGGFILAGRMQGYTGGGGNCGVIGPCYDLYLIRTNETGDTLWTKTYGTNNIEWAYSVEVTNDKGYLVAGQFLNDSSGFAGAYLVKTDSSGNALCNQHNTNTVVNNPVVITHSGWQIGPGGIIYPTNIVINPFNLFQDSIVCISTGITGLNTIENKVNIYPNPFHTNTTLTFLTPGNKNYTLYIYDGQGRKERSIRNIRESKIIIEREHAESGLYFFMLWSEQELIASGKFVIE